MIAPNPIDCQILETIYTGRKNSGRAMNKRGSFPVRVVYIVFIKPLPGDRETMSMLTTTTVDTKYGA
jgi:hypothetical protein